MPILHWNEKLSVGIDEIDQQHQKLIDMLNTAYDAIAEQREQEVVPRLVKEMRSYAMEHFLMEERLMEKYAYPDEEEHRRQHSEFMAKAALTDAGSAKGEVDHTDLFRFLSNWLSKHILKTDKALTAFVSEKGDA